MSADDDFAGFGAFDLQHVDAGGGCAEVLHGIGCGDGGEAAAHEVVEGEGFAFGPGDGDVEARGGDG